ncbi:MAG: 3-oxoacyl-[acyl-carrier-protein] reductase [Deltaproteobacteria bacterium]|jgi:3-oxoacyl-[acyl-carrier protein] reductase|nr:3-oxoacyl-[acyl-carrier-protein] reductase [Deltaproteobacteria bacterium]
MSKTILVTGGTRGIGKAVALKLAGTFPGSRLFLTHAGPRVEAVDGVLEEIRALGADAEASRWAVQDSAAGEAAIKDILDKTGRLDILVNNAGITRDGLSLRMTEEDFRAVLDVNLWGVFSLSRLAARHMLKERRGRIINVSSVVAFTGNPGQANYAASKAGIIGLTKTMALEFAPRGVTVNAVAPGFVETDMTGKLNDGLRERFLAKIPLGRFGSPADVARAVAFLASDEASYLTGVTIHVNGGLHLA